jgi:hypothetical protein
MKTTSFKIWRKSLPFLFIFILIHFLKDITQDILRISTPLDIFGDVKESISFLSKPVQLIFYYGLGGFSFVVEVFLLIAIPKIVRRKEMITTSFSWWLSLNPFTRGV